MQHFRVDQVRKTVDHRLSQQVFSRQLFQRRPEISGAPACGRQHRAFERQGQQELLQRLSSLM
jgi:hypothetical protein